MAKPRKPMDNPIVDPAPLPDERRLDASLRPRNFSEYVGQRAVVDKLRVYVAAARKRDEALDHCLFSGPPGLGKTSLAHIIAAELGVGLHVTSGPAIEKKGDLAGFLTNLAPGDVLFIDEIHRLSAAAEEYLYPAMEDLVLDIALDSGPHGRTVRIDVPPFTLIGATTRTGLLTSPLRERFQIQERLDFYEPDDLCLILKRSAAILGIGLDPEGAEEIARRARGTPRIANRLLRRLRDFAEVEADGRITRELADRSLRKLEIDALGLDPMDRKILKTILEKYGGGPVGIETIAASIGEERDTLEDVYEPFLLQMGFVQRTPRGRVATALAYRHFKLKPPADKSGQGQLW
ncbi:MAG: Holliday junction branch migration DNA helicase RuvB [Myxococcaceae bacterium]|nr:Holliday junction branch migration DNA helicase RuvB [Myxococcaceae bacterium]